MKIPFLNRTENRETDYSDTLVNLLLRRAQGGAVTATVSGALEAVAGAVGRAFLSAEVHGPDWATAALTPSVMQMFGRALIRNGDNVYHLDTGAGLTIIPGQTHSVAGGFMPSSWIYDVSLPGPSGTYGIVAGAQDVLHLRYATDPETPWRGAGPLQIASDAGRLSAEVLSALADEASGPVGSFLPLPKEDQTTGALKGDIRSAKGTMLTVESSAGSWDAAGPSPAGDWAQKRFGANPPQGLVLLLQAARVETWAACGISGALFEAADSASLREAYRLFLFSLIAPLGKLVQSELQSKIDPSIMLDWTDMRAADVQGRARALQSMTGGGMPLADAVALSGLLIAE